MDLDDERGENSSLLDGTVPNHLDIEKIMRFLNMSYALLGDNKLLTSYKTNRRVEEPYFTLLIIAYSLLIIFGTIGNSLVVSAVFRKATMRTVRNLFIINLAVSDLLLCLITMPLTLMEILCTYWPLPSSLILCKIVGSLQAVCVFVDIISITSIALDRYQVIVYPTNHSLQKLGAFMAVAGIWLFSSLLAAPLFIWKTLIHLKLDYTAIKLYEVDFCIEEWPNESGRAYYSVFTIVFHYLIITIVSFAYMGICKKLRDRMRPGSVGANASIHHRSSVAPERDGGRVRRTNVLLISIALIFGISWMPLNVLNVINDIYNPFVGRTQTYLLVYALCHMVGMSSACSNPVLYGWLNENFRKEFKDIWSSLNSVCCSRSENNNAQRRQSSVRRVEREQTTTVLYKKSKNVQEEGDAVEQSTLITQDIKLQK